MKASAELFSPISFRDPAGSLFRFQGRVIRLIRTEFTSEVEYLLSNREVRELIARGKLVATDPVSLGELFKGSSIPKGWDQVGLALEHERVLFPSYPYEWCPEMLYAAAELTLGLCYELFDQGLGLKDATPFNILFRHSNPVFVDFLSIEKREPTDPLWVPFSQFLCSFLNPLLAQKYLGQELSGMFLRSAEGLSSRQLFQMLSVFRRLTPPFLGLVTLPTILQSRFSEKTQRSHRSASSSQARFIFLSLMKLLKRKLAAAKPVHSSSLWTAYLERPPYSAEQLKTKTQFISESLARVGAAGVALDVGCNTGFFSELAADAGWSVVAIDSDPAVISRLWEKTRTTGKTILPLVVDIRNPSPPAGWQNRERDSFLERAEGRFDMVMMLALVHHLLETRIPLPQIIELAARLTRSHLIVEFVSLEDPSFQSMIRGRENLFSQMTFGNFEALCREHFQIISSMESIPGRRKIYLMRNNEYGQTKRSS